MATSPGFTLLELLAVLATLAIFLAIAAPAGRTATDALAAAGARDAVAGALGLARAEAPGRRGAYLTLDLGSGLGTVRGGRPGAPGAVLATLDIGRTFGARVDSRGAVEGTVTIAFDAYGIGRLASRSLTFRRGRGAAALTISSYGRVRRW
ncbi:MAG TPA: prepilin-type N-terminal cleavage/methylation domain-containing protein [Longimicrobiales bacterium]|nr:prepilin-type N-terminal cleavage/methylation domain-containing protein [Longimicrobiales bacterium]